jgi:hypothetical protein
MRAIGRLPLLLCLVAYRCQLGFVGFPVTLSVGSGVV